MRKPVSANDRIDFQKLFGPLGMHIKKVIGKPQYHNIVQDLVDFTGLPFLEVCRRILLRPKNAGHFVDEFKWQSPKTDEQMTWFYRSAQGYLFGSADRPFWDKLEFLKKDNEPVLDFGGGVGTNSIALAKKEIHVDYYDVSILQSEFVKFRSFQHGVSPHLMILSSVKFHQMKNGKIKLKFDPLNAINPTMRYKTIIMQDVLEHIPNYEKTLSHITKTLSVGGLLIEYAPFNPKEPGKGKPKKSPVHYEEKYPLKKAMKENGFHPIQIAGFEKGIWRKVRRP